MTETIFKANFYKRFVSYFWPIRIYTNHLTGDDFLEILLYQNRWQLATDDALYSDGDRYAPFRIAFNNINSSELKNAYSCLVLGAGLGSIAQILHKYNNKVSYTFVDNNTTILQWTATYLKSKKIQQTLFIHKDVNEFLNQCSQNFDIICMDIFKGRVVPPSVLQERVLQQCKNLLNENGYFVMNYMVHDTDELHELKQMIASNFSSVQIVEKRENRIFICKK